MTRAGTPSFEEAQLDTQVSPRPLVPAMLGQVAAGTTVRQTIAPPALKYVVVVEVMQLVLVMSSAETRSFEQAQLDALVHGQSYRRNRYKWPQKPYACRAYPNV